MSGHGVCRRAVGRDRRRQAGARPLPRSAAGRADRRRQYRRRFRASRALDLARSRHAALHPRRPRQSRNSAGAGATRPGPSWRRSKRSAARPGSSLGDGDLATHVERTRRLARRREPVADHRRFPPPPRDLGAAVADERRPRCARGCGPTRAGSTSRTISCGCAALRRSARSPLPAPATARPHPDFLAALADRRSAHGRDLPVEPVHQHRPDPEPVPGVREALRACRAPVIAVSPIIGGKAVKGPTAKMMAELGLPVDAGGGRAPLRRHPRAIYVDRRGGCGRGRRSRCPGDRDPHLDGDPRRSRGAGARGAGGRPEVI